VVKLDAWMDFDSVGPAMKHLLIALSLIVASGLIASCRGAGGPAQRVGYEMDRAAYKAGTGVARAGHAIQRAAR
jgi:predicted small secreted protein